MTDSPNRRPEIADQPWTTDTSKSTESLPSKTDKDGICPAAAGDSAVKTNVKESP